MWNMLFVYNTDLGKHAFRITVPTNMEELHPDFAAYFTPTCTSYTTVRYNLNPCTLLYFILSFIIFKFNHQHNNSAIKTVEMK